MDRELFLEISNAGRKLMAIAYQLDGMISQARECLIRDTETEPTLKVVKVDGLDFKMYECGLCGKPFHIDYKYCPYCGRKVMVKTDV